MAERPIEMSKVKHVCKQKKTMQVFWKTPTFFPINFAITNEEITSISGAYSCPKRTMIFGRNRAVTYLEAQYFNEDSSKKGNA